MKRLGLSLALALGIAGCSGSGGGSSTDGGYVVVEHVAGVNGAESTTARAELGSHLGLDRPKSGDCKAPDTASDDDASWLDAGPSITLVDAGSGASIELARASIGTRVVYGASGLPGTASPEGAAYDVVFAGSDDIAADTWSRAARIPEPVVPGELFNQIGFFAEQVIEWTPSADADEVIVEIGSGTRVDIACRVSGSKSKVTLSEEENNTLESGGGTLTFRAIRHDRRSLDGHGVATEGQSVVVVPYE